MNSGNIIDKYRSRQAATMGHRPDLFLSDYQILTDAAARVLIGWAGHLGQPSQKHIETFVLRTFEGKVKPSLESLRNFDKEGATELCVDLFAPKRPLDDAKGMAMIHASLYISAGDVWEVRRDSRGTPFLQRKSEENIQAILEAREKEASLYRNAQTRSGRIRFGQLKTAGTVVPHVGDRVKFYADGSVQYGNVRTLKSTGEVVVKAKGGGSYTLDPKALLETIEISPAARAEMEKRLEEYNSQWLGKDLGKQISRTEPTGTPQQ